VIYARRASPLHAARPVAAIAYCAALAFAALVLDHPLVLGVLAVTVVAAGLAARVGPGLARAARLGVFMALFFLVVNPLVAHQGITVIARFGEVGPLGQLDVTLEATVYGAILGLRALVIVLAFGLYAAAVDPDEVLRLFRRRGMRSALTVTLATRLVPVLARDASRLADGQRCRGTGAASRTVLVRAVASGALDRALDVAAALELRGYGARRPAGARGGTPWSRHDLAFAAAALAIAGLTVAALAAGWAGFEAYPKLAAAPPAEAGGFAAAVALCALAPFADRRGIA
jgi:energy-coupling factor transport system permease protein